MNQIHGALVRVTPRFMASYTPRSVPESNMLPPDRSCRRQHLKGAVEWSSPSAAHASPAGQEDLAATPGNAVRRWPLDSSAAFQVGITSPRSGVWLLERVASNPGSSARRACRQRHTRPGRRSMDAQSWVAKAKGSTLLGKLTHAHELQNFFSGLRDSRSRWVRRQAEEEGRSAARAQWTHVAVLLH